VYLQTLLASILLVLSTPHLALARDELLPKPSGPFPIGRLTISSTDMSRRETMSGAEGERRKLLIHIYYPSVVESEQIASPYFPNIRAQEAYEDQHFGTDFFKNEWGESYPKLFSTQTHASVNAKVASGSGRFPVVVFSHGGGIPVLFYSILLEELASQGYIVAAVEHSYDGDVVIFPDGQIIEQVGWDQDVKRTPEEKMLFHKGRQEVGAADDTFVLNQLERLNSGKLRTAVNFEGRLDTKHIAAVGHSFGGKLSIVACGRDPRFTTCVNLDGGLDPGDNYESVRQPVLAVYGGRRVIRKAAESEAEFQRRKASNDRFLDSIKSEYVNVISPESRYVFVDAPGFSHFSYYDMPTGDIPPDWFATADQWHANKQCILDILRGFLDWQLRGKSAEFTKAASAHPETIVEPIFRGPKQD
jgi:dienelactone hydrolase